MQSNSQTPQPTDTFKHSLVIALLAALSFYTLVQLSAPGQIVQAAGTLSGKVFSDYDSDGVPDTTEPGVGQVTVSVYPTTGSSSCSTTTTNLTGAWSINTATCVLPSNTALPAGPYRVEFTLPSSLSYYYPSARSTDSVNGGTSGNSGSTVQFVPDGTTSEINLALIAPADYSQSNPRLVTVAQNGSDATSQTTLSTDFAMLSVNYNRTSQTNHLTFAQIGSTWGVAHQRSTNRVFTSAFLKRHAGLGPRGDVSGAGPDDVDGVYVLNVTGNSLAGGFDLDGVTASNGGTIELGTVNRTQVAGSISSGAAGDYQLSTDDTTATVDLDAFAKVGTVGYGDIDFGEDDTTLWLVNLNDRTLIAVDTLHASFSISTSNPNNLASAAVKQYRIHNTSGASGAPLISAPTGFTNCTNGQLRPFALKFYHGKGYLGLVCDASTGTVSDLVAYVWSFNPTDPTTGFSNEVGPIAMNYNREFAYQDTNQQNQVPAPWQRWTSSWSDFTTVSAVLNFTTAPQPILGNIDFSDSGAMLLAFIDRGAAMGGNNQYRAISADRTLIRVLSVGDMLRVPWTGNTWGTAESGDTDIYTGATRPTDANQVSTFRTDDSAGNSGEFFWDDYFPRTTAAVHGETIEGGIVVRHGSGEVVSTRYDPVANQTWAQGIVFSNADTSAYAVNRYTLFCSGTTSQTDCSSPSANLQARFGKGSGLGDLELIALPAPIEIGNRVWRDDNGNGIQDANEMAIAGLTVRLYEGANLIATTTTDINGEWYFTSVASGNWGTDGVPNTSDDTATAGLKPSTNGVTHTYQIRIEPGQGNNTALLSGLGLTTANVAQPANGNASAATNDPTKDVADSDASVSSGNYIISYTSTVAGANNHSLDFGFAPLGAIGNRVWLDEDSNGYQDEGEDGLPNITVQLKDSGGTVIATTYTDANGNYLFKDLPAGSYFVQVLNSSVPTGLSQTTTYPNNGADLFNQNQSSGNGYSVTLSAGQENLTADFGYNWNPTSDVTTGGAANATAALGDRVWIDMNGNGYQDPSEVGVRGATVTLYYAAQNDGVYDDVYNVGGYTPTRTTDSNSNYIFDGLPPGAYVVQVTSDSGASHTIITSGYTQTGDPEHWGTTGTNNDNKTTTPVILGPGDVFLNADFGYQPSGATLGSIGNFVWFDRDADGVGPNVDADGAGTGSAETHGATGTADSEEGIGGVSVSLIRDTNGNGVWDSGEPIIATQFTSDGTQDVDGDGNVDAKGAYRFRGLQLTDGAGTDDYLVWVNDTNRVLDGLRATYDRDGSGAPSSGVVTGLGISAVTNLGTTGGTPYGSDNPTNQDFGYTGDGSGQRTSSAVLSSPTNTGVIGNYVWLDIDNDGVGPFGNGNAGNDNTEPPLPGVRVNLYDSTGALIATTLTGADGYYLFPNLPTSAGGIAYTVRIDTTTLPGGLAQTYDASGSQSDSASTATLTNASPSNLNQDFGYRGTGTVGNLVWKDLNADGVYQANGADGVGGTEDDETGISGVTLDIYFDTNRNGKIDPGEPKIGTTTTDANGGYLFSGLPTNDGSGSAYYVVDVTDTKGILAGYWHSLGTAGSNNNSQTDPYGVSISTGSPSNLTADFGYYPKFAALGNYVFNDANANGIQDGGEVGINGVVVQLTITYPNGTTTTLYTTTGDDPNTGGTQTGWYSFGNLLQDENYNTTGGSGPTFSISVVTADNTGALAGLVKTNVDQGANDKTDADNPAGVSATALKGVTNANQNATANNESTIASYDFGYTAPVNIGDRIWYDTNNNGTLDGGEAGINGVTVRLYRDTNGNGAFDSATDTLVATTTTANASGNDGTYNFTLLTPSIEATGNTHYFVVLPDTNFTSGGALASYSNSSSTVSANSNTNNADHGRVIGTLGQSGGYVVTQNAAGNNSGAVSVTLGGEPTNDGDGNNGNLTLDFGFYRLTASGKVWLDNGAGGGTSNNGMLDGSEGGLNNVRVELYKNNVLVAVGFTNSSGDYSFTQQTDSNGNGNNRPLEPGSDYTISIPSGQNILSTLKSSADVSSTTNPTNTGNGVQSDDNGVGTDPGSSTITTSTFTLGATGTSNTAGSTFTNSNGTTSQPTIYFGFTLASPTSIDLGAVIVVPNEDVSVQIDWETLNESAILGFNILRSERKNSATTQVNDELIAALSVGQLTGNPYSFTDTSTAPNQKYFYRLEVVRANDETTLTEPIAVTTAAGACSGKPNAPALLGPAHDSKIKKAKIVFTWESVECAATYRWQVRADNADGEVIETKKDLSATETTFKKLQRGKTYVWRVGACNAADKCTWSEWWSVTIRVGKNKEQSK